MDKCQEWPKAVFFCIEIHLGFIRPAHAHVWVASTSNPTISHLQGHPKVFKVAIPLDVAFQFLSFHHIPQGTCSCCYRCESLWIAESDTPAFPAFPALLSIACEDVNPGPADHPKTAQGPARARGRVFGPSRRVLSARRAETATGSKQSKLQSGILQPHIGNRQIQENFLSTNCPMAFQWT